MNKALIIGLGISGKSAATYLQQKGYDLVGYDSKPIKMDFPVFPDADAIDLSDLAFAVLSPGIALSHPLCKRLQERGIDIVGEAELAFSRLHQTCLAVTGTNGKTTVTLLAAHILNSAGIPARALGNVGDPLAAYLLNPHPQEVIVAELSSFQLETMTSPVFDAGVILNITPDHLDRYASMEEYAIAKCRLQKCMKEGAPLYVHSKAYLEYSRLCPHAISYSDSETFASLLPVRYRGLGVHERENAIAAWLLVQKLGVTKEAFCAALETFSKPHHRIEYVATIGGVDYYDDSKGTNIDAAIAAVDSMKGSVILIAGGLDKGSSYAPWKNAFRGKVKAIFAIGQAKEKIKSELQDAFTVTLVEDLGGAVKEAARVASRGDAVLLSPGCASYDQFRDYVHRGEEFKRCVYHLEERGGER